MVHAREDSTRRRELASTQGNGHGVLAGSLWKEDLGIVERAMIAAVHAPEGDFRPWAEIDEWAGVIAGELAVPA
jgi:menaquinone-dependent protoporphyrinogen oxidase